MWSALGVGRTGEGCKGQSLRRAKERGTDEELRLAE